MQTEHSDKLVAVGRVIKARGLEGKLKVKPLTDFIQRFEKLDSVKVELSPYDLTRGRITYRNKG